MLNITLKIIAPNVAIVKQFCFLNGSSIPFPIIILMADKIVIGANRQINVTDFSYPVPRNHGTITSAIPISPIVIGAAINKFNLIA